MQREHGLTSKDRSRPEDRSRLVRRHGPLGHGRLVGLVALGLFAVACSSDPKDPVIAGTGGSAAAGSGGAGATGAVTATGATSSGATGAVSSGGVAGTGGSALGGSSTGGSDAVGATGGTSTSSGGSGGQATGGAGTGGDATGGDGTGGTAAGGQAAGGTGTGGDATGGDATGGEATGGSGPTPVVPEKISNSDYRFTVGDVVLDVNPQVGGRVTTLTLGGADIIEPYDCGSYDPNTACNSSGSTIWTSPQADWNWPPVAAIDGEAYAATVEADHLVLKGDADSDLGAGITKDISADSGTGWITLTFTIDATKSVQAALWQITRVARGGLAVFPVVSSTNGSDWTVSESGGYEWLDDENQTNVTSGGPKIIADGSGGWLAYLRDGNLLLIKYPDVEAADIAPDEGDVEIYPGDGYIELEVQGPYESIGANQSSSPWTVQWRVVPVPSTVTVAVGDTGLIEFIEQQVAM